MFDISIYAAVIIAIIIRLVIMKGSFVLPTFYKVGNEVSFNLGSISTIIIGLIAAFALMQTQPELFSNWYVAAVTAYTAPQIVDSVITAGTRYTQNKGEPIEPTVDEASEDVDFSEEEGA